MKSILQSRTFWVNVLSMLLAILALPEVGTIAPQWLPYIGGATAIINVVLRFLTIEPVAMKMPEKDRGPYLGALLVLMLAGSTVACAGLQPAQPLNLSPEAQVAWRNLEIVRVLDLVRDIAIDAEKQGLVTTNTARRVVRFHISSLTAIKAMESGWSALVLQALDDMANDIPGKDRPLLGPYVELIRKALKR